MISLFGESRTAATFIGSLDELKAIVQSAGCVGAWTTTDGAHQFRAKKGHVISSNSYSTASGSNRSS